MENSNIIHKEIKDEIRSNKKRLQQQDSPGVMDDVLLEANHEFFAITNGFKSQNIAPYVEQIRHKMQEYYTVQPENAGFLQNLRILNQPCTEPKLFPELHLQDIQRIITDDGVCMKYLPYVLSAFYWSAQGLYDDASKMEFDTSPQYLRNLRNPLPIEKRTNNDDIGSFSKHFTFESIQKSLNKIDKTQLPPNIESDPNIYEETLSTVLSLIEKKGKIKSEDECLQIPVAIRGKLKTHLRFYAMHQYLCIVYMVYASACAKNEKLASKIDFQGSLELFQEQTKAFSVQAIKESPMTWNNIMCANALSQNIHSYDVMHYFLETLVEDAQKVVDHYESQFTLLNGVRTEPILRYIFRRTEGKELEASKDISSLDATNILYHIYYIIFERRCVPYEVVVGPELADEDWKDNVEYVKLLNDAIDDEPDFDPNTNPFDTAGFYLEDDCE